MPVTADPDNTVSRAAADTLTSDDSHEEFSIGRIIPLPPGTRSSPVPEIVQGDPGTGYISVTGRSEGQPLPAEKLSSDFGFLTLSVSLFLVTLMISFGRKSTITGLSYLSFRRQAELAPPGTTELLSWTAILRNIFTVINTGLFAAIALLLTGIINYDSPSRSVRLTAILSGSLLAALMLRHLTCIIAAEVTGWKNIFREYLKVIYNTWFANAILLFILSSVILFAPVNNIKPFIITGLVFTAISLIIRALRLLSIFARSHISILYFILYLCALEVLPALVILKALGAF